MLPVKDAANLGRRRRSADGAAGIKMNGGLLRGRRSRAIGVYCSRPTNRASY